MSILGSVKKILSKMDPVQAYIILVLGARNLEPVRGKIWLQKELFLIAQRIDKIRDLLGYEPYLLGPWSESVDVALEQLQSMGLIRINGKIELTELGEKVYSIIRGKASEGTIKIIEQVKEDLNDLDEEGLLAYIYFLFPDEWSKESVKARELERKRTQLAIELYRKGKVSLGKATEIAKMNLHSFIELLKKKGIEISLEY